MPTGPRWSTGRGAGPGPSISTGWRGSPAGFAGAGRQTRRRLRHALPQHLPQLRTAARRLLDGRGAGAGEHPPGAAGDRLHPRQCRGGGRGRRCAVPRPARTRGAGPLARPGDPGRRGAGRSRGCRCRVAGARLRNPDRRGRPGRAARGAGDRSRDPVLHRRHDRPLEGRAAQPPQRRLERHAGRPHGRHLFRRRLSARRADVPFRRPARHRFHADGQRPCLPAGIHPDRAAGRNPGPRRDLDHAGADNDHHDAAAGGPVELRPLQPARLPLRQRADGGGMGRAHAESLRRRRPDPGLRPHRDLADPDADVPPRACRGDRNRQPRPAQGRRPADYRRRHAYPRPGRA